MLGCLILRKTDLNCHTLDRQALPLCHQVALFAVQLQQRAASFPYLQKIGVRKAFLPWQSQLWEPLRGLELSSSWDQCCGAWLCDYNKCYSHLPTENNLVMNQPTETWASLLAAEHTPEHMNAPSRNVIAAERSSCDFKQTWISSYLWHEHASPLLPLFTKTCSPPLRLSFSFNKPLRGTPHHLRLCVLLPWQQGH